MTPMPNATRLQILVDLRRQIRPRLSQSAVARKFALDPTYGRKAISAWELGEAIPSRDRRVRFMGYLWDDLGLRKTPARFAEVWQILVEEWQWRPISDEEWQLHFGGVKGRWYAPPVLIAVPQERVADAQPLPAPINLAISPECGPNSAAATYLFHHAFMHERQGNTTESMLTEMGYFQ